MAGELVLVTGATGHIGYRTLIEALSQGYQVRAAVRSDAKREQIVNAPPTKPYASQLSFVIVPDIEVEGAFDSAVQGVDHIIHLASPLSSGATAKDFEAEIIQPAIRGTLSILNSALKAPTIKRIAITSSVAAVSPSEPRPYDADNIEPDPSGPYPHYFAAYAASKKLAYNRTRAFVTEHHPSFSIINVMPTFVFGPNRLATTRRELLSGSNALVLLRVLGGEVNEAGMWGNPCHVDDVAFVHVKALSLNNLKPGELKNFGVNYTKEKFEWDDAKEVVRKEFPRAVEEKVFNLEGKIKTLAGEYDASKTEKELGVEFKSYKTAVKDLVEYYLSLP
jgi:nucleoside-diphosphate-sugar epimerase